MMQSAMKWTVRTLVIAVALGLLASPAFAAQNVANTAQKGSLLIFPLIDVRDGTTTVVRISNDANVAVDVKCYYVNETKFRADFVFRLTKKQSLSFDARTGFGSEPLGNVQPFPTEVGGFPLRIVLPAPGVQGNPFLGELVCFAVNPAGSAQISHNHLSGTATVGSIDGRDSILLASYEYNSWNFVARGVARGTSVGAAGRLDLTGLAGAYDACPAYNIVHLSPTVEPGEIGDIVATHRIGVSTCAQDLRQDYTPHYTKLEWHIWNGHEVKFTGAWQCSNSTHSFLLSELDVLPGNASREVLGTDTAFAQVRGVASPQCRTPFATEDTGLVAVSARVVRIGINEEGRELPLHGTTTNHAGIHAVPGFVLWDPQDDEVPEAPRR